MKFITQYVPEGHICKLEELVRKGYYPNRAEAIRMARDGYFYWLFTDAATVGRKKVKQNV